MPTTPTDIADLQLTNLANLPQDVVDLQTAIMREAWRKLSPDLEVDAGVLDWLVTHPSALFTTMTAELIRAWRRSTHLLDLADSSAENPIVSKLLDYAAGNYRITRAEGAYATGLVEIVLTQEQEVTYPAGFKFMSGDVVFEVVDYVTTRPVDFVASDVHNKPLVRLSDGRFAFTTLLRAVEISSQANISRGTPLTPITVPPPYFYEAYASEAFTGGTEEESNESLARRAVYGISQPLMNGRVHMSTMLRQEFPDVVSDSIVGLSDEEMVRDRANIFGLSSGGVADWYIRSTKDVSRITVTKTAIRSGTQFDGTGLYGFTLGKMEAPAAYFVEDVRLASTGQSLSIVSTTRGVDLTPTVKNGYVPRIASYVDAVYSPWQIIDVVVSDPLKLAGETESLEVVCDVVLLPQMREIQEYVADESRRALDTDVMVKAPTPCFVSVGMSVSIPAAYATWDSTSLKTQVASAVNSIPLGRGVLPVSAVMTAAQREIPSGGYVESFSMLGKLMLPDGTVKILNDSQSLTLASAPYGTARTASFFCDASSVSVTTKLLQ